MADEGDDVVASTMQPGRRPGERMPRWVKVSLILAGVLVALFVGFVKLTGAGGEHGPGRHGQSATPSVDRTSAASTIDARSRPVEAGRWS